MTNDSLRGQVVVVTGASSGIGAAIAIELGSHGAKVALVGRSTDRLQTVEEKVVDAGGIAIAIVADVAEIETAEQIVDRTLEHFGAVDHVVPMAGIYDVVEFASTTVESYERQIATNVRAPFFLVQQALPHLHEGSAVVLPSSILATSGSTMSAAYTVTKAGVDGLTRALAVELAPKGIRVNAIAPGCIETGMNDTMREDRELTAFYAAGAALDRWGTPEEIAPGVAFLLSSQASFICGTTLAIDGGWLIKK